MQSLLPLIFKQTCLSASLLLVWYYFVDFQIQHYDSHHTQPIQNGSQFCHDGSYILKHVLCKHVDREELPNHDIFSVLQTLQFIRLLTQQLIIATALLTKN